MANPLKGAPPRIRAEQVIVLERSEGKGIESEPIRLVRYLYTLEGRLLGRLDSMDYPKSEQAEWGF